MSAQLAPKAAAQPHDAPQAPAPSPLADPGPLGLAAFAMTTFVLSMFNSGIMDKALEPVVLPLALFYGGMGQVIAGILEYRKGNTFGVLAFSSYGAFWLAFAAYVKFVVGGLPADQAHLATGIFLVGWTIFTGYMLIASLRTSMGLIGVFGLLFLTFLFLAIGTLAQSDPIHVVGGILGLATALMAWYCSFAGVLNQTWKRTVLPLGPRG